MYGDEVIPTKNVPSYAALRRNDGVEDIRAVDDEIRKGERTFSTGNSSFWKKRVWFSCIHLKSRL